MPAMKREEIIGELKRVADLLGRNSFSRTDFKRYGRINSGTVERTFGTWNSALEAADLVPIDRFKRISDSELEDEWKRAHQKIGKTPTRNEFFAESKFSPSVYEKRFGNWGNVVRHYLGSHMATLVLDAGKPAEPKPASVLDGVEPMERPSRPASEF